MILKKGWFSDLEILEIYWHVSHEEYEQNLPTLIETQNTEKLEAFTGIKQIINIPTDNITELNKLLYTGTKLICDKIDIPQGNLNKITKPGREIQLKGQKKKKTAQISKSAKEGKTHKDMLGWKDQNKTADKSDNTTGRNKSKDIGKRRKTQKISG